MSRIWECFHIIYIFSYTFVQPANAIVTMSLFALYMLIKKYTLYFKMELKYIQ